MATQAELDEARAALHKLLTGAQSVEVSTAEGDTVKYTPAQEDKLRAYIAELDAELNGPAGGRKRAAVRVRF